MRCNICDRALSDTEVIWNKEISTYEPCSTCLDIALDAAYSEGFVKDEEELYEELGDDDLGSGEVETLDQDTFQSSPDQYNFSFDEDRYTD